METYKQIEEIDNLEAIRRVIERKIRENLTELDNSEEFMKIKNK